MLEDAHGDVYFFDIVLQTFSPAKAIHTGLGVLLVVCDFLKPHVRIIVTSMFTRRPRV